MKKFASPKERQKFLDDLAISAQFQMRHRGLLEYYGKELIAYKRANPTDESRNEFLRVLARYMSHHLEDSCPPSWKECQSSFWEELIYTCLPHHLQITQQEKQVETQLNQLKKFVHWLDQRVGTSHYKLVKKMAEEAESDLKSCERLLNHLFLRIFPSTYEPNVDPVKDYMIYEQWVNQFDNQLISVFEVTSMIEKTVVLTDMETNKTYYVKGLPCHLLVRGMAMIGGIGNRKNEMAWEWIMTESVYPQTGRKYLKLGTKVPSSKK